MAEQGHLIAEIKKKAAEIIKLCDSLMVPGQVPPTPPPSPTKPEPLVARVKKAFTKDLLDLVTITDKPDAVIVKPKKFLGTENFVKIASTIRGLGGDYVSAGKDSHFRVPKE